MSPEQMRGQAVDQRGDVWAFGCVLYEMLSGQKAFTGATVSDSIAAVLDREPDWSALPSDCPPLAHRLLRHCLAKDRHERLRHIGDARIDLKDWAQPPAEDFGRRIGPLRGPHARVLGVWAVKGSPPSSRSR